jgi:hypothetical protein
MRGGGTAEILPKWATLGRAAAHQPSGVPRIAVTVDVLQLVDVKAAESQPSLYDPNQHSIGRLAFWKAAIKYS